MASTDTAEIPASPERRSRGWLKYAIPIVALLIGTGIGAAASGKQTAVHQAVAKQTAADQTAIGRQKAADKVTIDSLTNDVDTLNGKVQTATDQAKAKAQADYAAKLAAVKAREDAVAKREAAVGTAETQATANTISGDGTFVVGTDVKPGTYRTAAPTSGNCYWARLSDLGGGGSDSIIANNNSAGPSVVTIRSGDRGFETAGCEDFHKIG